MLYKFYYKLKYEGIKAVLKGIFFFLFKKRVKNYSNIKKYLINKIGLEIGGPSEIFSKCGKIPAYFIANKIDNCNFCSDTIWEGKIKKGNYFIFNNKNNPGYQYIAEASDLRDIKSESYDFVMSSHCLEHLANPIQALNEWTRVLKEDGLFLLILPHKDGTFDHRRRVTLLDHLISDYNRQTNENDMTHLEEILEFHDLSMDIAAGDFQSFKARSMKNFENRCLHHHVFDTKLVVDIFDYIGLKILIVEVSRPFDIIVIGKKLKKGKAINNEKFKAKSLKIYRNSPFPSDQYVKI